MSADDPHSTGRVLPSLEVGRMRWILRLAAIYNALWGLLVILRPEATLDWLGLPRDEGLLLWQCIGMLVGVYALGYWIASVDPYRFWPLVLVGLVGKVLGPVGAVPALLGGELPARFLWVNATNDLIWWVPFGWILWRVLGPSR